MRLWIAALTHFRSRLVAPTRDHPQGLVFLLGFLQSRFLCRNDSLFYYATSRYSSFSLWSCVPLISTTTSFFSLRRLVYILCLDCQLKFYPFLPSALYSVPFSFVSLVRLAFSIIWWHRRHSSQLHPIAIIPFHKSPKSLAWTSLFDCPHPDPYVTGSRATTQR